MNHETLFEDLKVVELASVLAGPAVGMFFAELGAKVIKVENKTTGGDVTRKWKLPKEDPHDPYSAYYHSINWGKETMLVDLNDSRDFKKVEQVIQDADIVISNLKSDSALRLKLDYASVRAMNEEIIYGSISAYGHDDNTPGFDAMMQAETGWISMTGHPDGPPVKLPVALIDLLAGHQLKQGVLTALIKKLKSGKGSHVTVSLYDASIAALANQASNWLNVQHLPRPMGTQHPNIAPYGDTFVTKDLRRIILGVGTDGQFEGLCKIINRIDLIADNRFTSNTARVQNRKDLVDILSQSIEKFELAKFQELCKKYKVTMAPINDLESLFQSPKAKELILTSKTEASKEVYCVQTSVFKFVE